MENGREGKVPIEGLLGWVEPEAVNFGFTGKGIIDRFIKAAEKQQQGLGEVIRAAVKMRQDVDTAIHRDHELDHHGVVALRMPKDPKKREQYVLDTDVRRAALYAAGMPAVVIQSADTVPENSAAFSEDKYRKIISALETAAAKLRRRIENKQERQAMTIAGRTGGHGEGHGSPSA